MQIITIDNNLVDVLLFSQQPVKNPGDDPKEKPEIEPEKMPEEEPGIQPGKHPGKKDDDDDNPFKEPEIGDDPEKIKTKVPVM